MNEAVCGSPVRKIEELRAASCSTHHFVVEDALAECPVSRSHMCVFLDDLKELRNRHGQDFADCLGASSDWGTNIVP